MARCIALQGYAKRNPEREVPEARKLKALEANNAKQKTLSAKQKMGVSTLKDMPGKTGGPMRDAGPRSVARQKSNTIGSAPVH
ncbi:MAG: hypothetical protein AAF666_19855, partial [Pseudomonadota bacterium]